MEVEADIEIIEPIPTDICHEAYKECLEIREKRTQQVWREHGLNTPIDTVKRLANVGHTAAIRAKQKVNNQRTVSRNTVPKLQRAKKLILKLSAEERQTLITWINEEFKL